jgi:uncharacterized protein YlxW (UPF0749 family)
MGPEKMKIRKLRRYLLLTVVLTCAGYLVSYSYHYTKEFNLTIDNTEESNTYWHVEDQLREKVAEVSMENLRLEEQLKALQQQVNDKEAEVSQFEQKLSAIYDELETYRLLAGVLEAKGPGVIVTLEDRYYDAKASDPNDYIVHEQDVRGVVNELFAAGAEGISINGQRFVQSTSIRCVGPTIIVNDVKSTAPFEIIAVGDPDTLYTALHMPGGYVDVLESWGITVKVEKKEEVRLPAYVGDF